VSVRPSDKASRFTESVIREMTRLANLHGAVNLSQGFPDFPAPEAVKEAARRAVAADVNQYAITWGARGLREAIAAKFTRLYGLPVDPEREVTVTCGSTEAMIAALLALVDAGDEVVVFEPFYENYGPDAILSDASPRFVKLRPPEWSFDPGELERAFGPRTRAVIVNTPNNPTGKVFSREELGTIAALCRKHDAVAITDEIYEHILYDGAVHVPIATLPGMAERTITINGLSKTYSVTGWRVGWCIAPPVLTGAIRKVHDFLTVGAAAPLQEAGVVASTFPPRTTSGWRPPTRGGATACSPCSSDRASRRIVRAGPTTPWPRSTRWDGTTTWPSRVTSSRRSGWRWYRARPSTRTPRTAASGSASPSARRTKRWTKRSAVWRD